MRLRPKVLLTTFAVMILGYVIVTLAFMAHMMQSARDQNAALARQAFSLAAHGVAAARPPNSRVREEMQERLARTFYGSALMDKWFVVDASGTVVAAEDGVRTGQRAISPGQPVGEADGLRLYGQVLPGSFSVSAQLLALAPAMFLVTLLLAAVLWAALSRLVLTPVVELAEVSRLTGSGVPDARARGEGRADEVGDLVRAFNRMSAEVAAGRATLERRVEEATEKSRRAQEAANIAQRLAATGKLAAGVAHEINNPLGGMINAARALESSVPPGDKRGREYLGLIEEGLDRVGRIVKRMLHFQRSRVAGSTTGPVDLAEALDSALRFAEHRLKGVELVRELASETPVVLGARQELEQVFLNLILNAADAVRDSAAKRVTVRVHAEESGRWAVVEIEDTGCGMTSEEAQAAFDIFHTTKSEGTGLGLPVAHSIVQSHGGELSLESVKGRGTKAVVRLPVGNRGS